MSFIYFFKRNEPEIVGVFYHGVSKNREFLCIDEKIFEQQIEYLVSKKYYFASQDEVVKFVKGELKLPKKTVFISFDDGFSNIYENAMPILKKYNIVATLFLNTGFINKELSFQDTFKLKSSNVNYNPEFKFLSTNEVMELSDNNFDIEPHTHAHIDMSSFTIEEISDQVNKSIVIIESILTKKINYFSYPYGYYNDISYNYVKEHKDIKAAFGVSLNNIRRDSDIFDIPRKASANITLIRFKILVSPFEYVYEIIKNRDNKLRARFFLLGVFNLLFF